MQLEIKNDEGFRFSIKFFGQASIGVALLDASNKIKVNIAAFRTLIDFDNPIDELLTRFLVSDAREAVGAYFVAVWRRDHLIAKLSAVLASGADRSV